MLKTTEYETFKNTAPMTGSWSVENIFPYLTMEAKRTWDCVENPTK